MKNKLIAGLAAIAAAVVLVIGGGAVANAYVVDHGLVYASVVRNTGTTLTASSGAYTNLTSSSNTSKWYIDEAGGFTLDSDGITVPVDGVYELSWATMLTSGGSGIAGFVLDGQTPDGSLLGGVGPIVNSAAAIGNGSYSVFLPAGTEVDFWAYGNGGSMTLQTGPVTRLSVVLLQEYVPEG